jgi:hypothetical protein
MTLVMASCAVIALLVFLMGRKLIVQQASMEAVEEEDIEMISTI